LGHLRPKVCKNLCGRIYIHESCAVWWESRFVNVDYYDGAA
jgi:hypothetical protein